MTAAQAISRECRWCNTLSQSACVTGVCKLHPGVWQGKRSKVRQIKAHCLECAGTMEQVKSCNGRVLRENGNGNGNICWLHPYRTGKNPGRVKSGSRPPSGFLAKRAGDALPAPRIDAKVSGGGNARVGAR